MLLFIFAGLQEATTICSVAFYPPLIRRTRTGTPVRLF